jgi:hypothetical protein
MAGSLDIVQVLRRIDAAIGRMDLAVESMDRSTAACNRRPTPVSQWRTQCAWGRQLVIFAVGCRRQ